RMDSLIERAADEKAAGSGESSAREIDSEQEKEVSLVAFAVDMGRREKNKRSSKRKEINGDVHSLEMIRDIESVENNDSSEDDFRKVLEDVNDEKFIIGKMPLDSDSFEYFVEDGARTEELKKVEQIDEQEKEKEMEVAQMEEMMMEEVELMANSTTESLTNSTVTEEVDIADHHGTSIIKEHSKRQVEHHEVEGSGMEEPHKKKKPAGRHDRHMKGGRKGSNDTMTEDRGEMKVQEKMMGNRTHSASPRQAEENQLGETNEKDSTDAPAGSFKPTEFSLPKLDGGRASFSLREHGKLADFHWLGIYDQCTKKAYQLHEIAGSEIPDLESVSPLTGVAANVSSDSVQIVNCNTIVIQNFHFLKDTKRPSEQFTDHDDILDTVNGSDLVVKLPDGIRTFDVDFLMVFNEDSNRSYGHTFIPSLLVPP
ncbi:hypothetical protein PENTCL1PPCAC_29636, partial [Pristionchus entomophagus]